MSFQSLMEKTLKRGSEVRLLTSMAGGFIKKGTRGYVLGYDKHGNIQIYWENGITMSIIDGQDMVEVI